MGTHLFKKAAATLLSRSLLMGSVLALSGCQLYDMASYQWHNADAQPVFSDGKVKTSLPFKLVNNHILLEVTVNGSGPLSFVLDSGAAATVITQTAATDALRLPKDNELVISGTGEGKDPVAYMVHDTKVQAGSLAIKELTIIYAPTEAMPFDSYEETYFDGVLGADFFNCCLVEINYDTQQVVFYSNEKEQVNKFAGDNWQRLKMDVDGNTPFLHTVIKDEEGEKTVKLLLDTGSTGTLSLFAGKGEFVVPAETYSTRSTGISGDSINHVGHLGSFSLGNQEFKDLPVYFRTEGSSPESGSHGILGNRVMRRFNQVFDFKGQRYWVQPNKVIGEGVFADRSGLRLLPHEDGAVLKDIAQDTAAANLDISLNSIVTHINGELVTKETFDTLSGLLRSPQHSKVSLCWTQENEKQCSEITLQDRLTTS